MEKKVVYESRPKLIALLVISGGFVVMSLWTGYLPGLIFFGLCALTATYPLLDPRKKLVFYGTPAYHAHIARAFAARQADPGGFTYSERGFGLPSPTAPSTVAWDEVRAVFAYKRDLYTTDEICLDVFCHGDGVVTITEKTAGWHVFVTALAAHLPTISPGWLAEVSVPAFETKLTLPYERANRSFAQAVAAYYPAATQPVY